MEIIKSKRPNTARSRLFRGAAVFLAAALIVQLICMLIMTRDGQMLIYPAAVRLHASKITENNLSVAEFYPMHDEISDAKVIILSVDEYVAGSYTLAESYLGFLRRFVDLDYVVLYDTNTKFRALNDAAIAGDTTALAESLAQMKKSKSISDQMISFVEECSKENAKLLPNNKFSMFGIRKISSIADIASNLTSDLFASPGVFNAEVQTLISERDSAAFCEKFNALAETLSSALGDNFAKYQHYVELIEAGTLAESVAYETLISLVPTEGGAIFAVLPESLCRRESPFLSMVEAYYGKTVVNRTMYYDCETRSGRDTVKRNDLGGAFMFGEDSVYIIPKTKTENFRRRLADICDKDPDDGEIYDLIGDAGASTVFAVSRSGTVTYGSQSNTDTTSDTSDTTAGVSENADT